MALVTTILAVLLSTDPYATFAFVREFDTYENCNKYIKQSTLEPEIKQRMTCLRITTGDLREA